SSAKTYAALTTLSPQAQVRGLARLCQQLSQQYQSAPDTCLERSWWRRLNQAGILFQKALDQAKAAKYHGLDDQEVEQACFLLIHIAYFFAPGGVAETMWPLLPAEEEEQHVQFPAREALNGAFARR